MMDTLMTDGACSARRILLEPVSQNKRTRLRANRRRCLAAIPSFSTSLRLIPPPFILRSFNVKGARFSPASAGRVARLQYECSKFHKAFSHNSSSLSSATVINMQADTIQHLEDISRTMVDAVNMRDFSTSSPMWSHMSNRFKGDLEQYRAWGETHAKVGPTELEEHFDTFRNIVKDHPEYHQKILSLDTTVESKAGTAEVLVHSEVTGLPAGIVRETMAVFGFRRIEGQWLCVRCTGIRGFDATGAM